MNVLESLEKAYHCKIESFKDMFYITKNNSNRVWYTITMDQGVCYNSIKRDIPKYIFDLRDDLKSFGLIYN